MTTVRGIRFWLSLLQRPCCQRAAATTTATCRLLTPSNAAKVNTAHQQWQRGPSTIQSRAFSLSACRLKSTDDHSSSGFIEEEEEDDDFLEDSEVEELFQQQASAGIREGQHRVFIVHPDVKWGSKKQYLTTGNKTSMRV